MPTEKTRYDAVAQVLHWGTAIAIVAAFILIQSIEDMPRGPEKAALMDLHKSLGVTVLALTAARLAWRWISPPPALPPGTAPWAGFAAAAGHGLLYALMLAVPLSGLVMAWAGGRPVEVFGLFTLPSLLGASPDLKEAMEEVHEVVGTGIMILAGLHAAVALVHQWVLCDGTLTRMLPGRAGQGA